MCIPSLSPLYETSVRNHVLVVHTPTLLHYRIQNCLDQGKPVGLGLDKLEVGELMIISIKMIMIYIYDLACLIKIS